MTVKVSTWWPLRPGLPTISNQLPIDIARKNLFSLLSQTVVGYAPEWSYTNSVTRAEASPGTAALPARKYFKKGSGNSTQWLKVICTYTGSNLTKAALYYSSDNEASYTPLTGESGNYVLTLSYDGSNNLTLTSWGIA